jgi:PKD repeat protein
VSETWGDPNKRIGGIQLYTENATILRSEICYSKTYGILCYELIDTVNPAIISHNIIHDNGHAGIKFYKAYAEVSYNQLINNPFGLDLYRSAPTLTSNYLINNTYGLICADGSAPLVRDSVIRTLPTQQCAIDLDSNSDVQLINTTFDRNSVYIRDMESSLTVRWYLTISVINEMGHPVEDANVTVYNQYGDEVFKGSTDIDGYYLRSSACAEYTETKAGKIYETPHTIVAYKPYKGSNTTQVEMTANRDIKLILRIADLCVTKLTFSDDMPLAQESVEIIVTLTNYGTLTASDLDGKVDVGFYVDANLICVTAIDKLLPSRTADAKCIWKTVRGTHQVRVKIDPYDKIEESDETNNVLQAWLVVGKNVTAKLVVYPTKVFTGTPVYFSAESSISDFPLLAYFFDYGDGKNSSWVTQPLVTHTYSDDGIYEAKVKLRDEHGESAWSLPVLIEVLNRAPVITKIIVTGNISADYTTYRNKSLFFSAIAHDDDGSIINYCWSFGDGKTAYGLNVTHSYHLLGAVKVTLEAIDDDMESNYTSIILSILNTPPTAQFVVSQAAGNVTTWFKFDASTSNDSDGAVVKYYWKFGDDADWITTLEPIIYHKFNDDLVYTVALKVMDNDLTNSTPATKMILINNLPPMAKITVSATIVSPNTVVLISAHATYDPDDNITELNYTWLIEDLGTKYGSEIYCVYSEPGKYKIVLIVRDDDSAESCSTAWLEVQAPQVVKEERRIIFRHDILKLALAIIIVIAIIAALIGYRLLRKRS